MCGFRLRRSHCGWRDLGQNNKRREPRREKAAPAYIRAACQQKEQSEAGIFGILPAAIPTQRQAHLIAHRHGGTPANPILPAPDRGATNTKARADPCPGFLTPCHLTWGHLTSGCLTSRRDGPAASGGDQAVDGHIRLLLRLVDTGFAGNHKLVGGHHGDIGDADEGEHVLEISRGKIDLRADLGAA